MQRVDPPLRVDVSQALSGRGIISKEICAFL
jgi:hypothetical protein